MKISYPAIFQLFQTYLTNSQYTTLTRADYIYGRVESLKEKYGDKLDQALFFEKDKEKYSNIEKDILSIFYTKKDITEVLLFFHKENWFACLLLALLDERIKLQGNKEKKQQWFKEEYHSINLFLFMHQLIVQDHFKPNEVYQTAAEYLELDNSDPENPEHQQLSPRSGQYRTKGADNIRKNYERNIDKVNNWSCLWSKRIHWKTKDLGRWRF